MAMVKGTIGDVSQTSVVVVVTTLRPVDGATINSSNYNKKITQMRM